MKDHEIEKNQNTSNRVESHREPSKRVETRRELSKRVETRREPSNRVESRRGKKHGATNHRATKHGATKHRATKRGGRLTTVLLVAMLAAGIGLISYPTVSNWWNSMHQSRAIMEYAQNTASMDPKLRKQILRRALRYNQRLAETGQLWHMTAAQKKEYEKQLNPDGTGVMGYITVPEIRIQLPVYHGTEDAVLQTSIGHIEGTALPVGGKSSHSVLSGHRGLPSARLFTDLDKLSAGDTFTITSLDRTITYQVDQVKVVKPDNLKYLEISRGRDFCTLVTCTPYGINTHRLLVRGHRIPNLNGDANVLADAIPIRPAYIVPFVVAAACAVLAFLHWRARRQASARTKIAAGFLASHGL